MDTHQYFQELHILNHRLPLSGQGACLQILEYPTLDARTHAQCAQHFAQALLRFQAAPTISLEYDSFLEKMAKIFPH